MSRPIGTLAIVAANLLAFRTELAGGGLPFCLKFGLIPARPEPAAFVTNLFLHDPRSMTHILGNMAFLAVFGLLVEGGLGTLGFLALYLVAGVAGGLLHVLSCPGTTDALVGASGAISGVLAVTVAMRPRLFGFAAAFVGVNAWHAFFGSDAGVSFAAHLGGFFAGFVVALVLRVMDSEALEIA